MYVHHTAGSLQKSGCSTSRQRHLSDLMVVCRASKESGDSRHQEDLLDWLVRYTAECAPSEFINVLTSEPDGSFVCRAGFQNHSYRHTYRKNKPVPAAAWPVYARVSSTPAGPGSTGCQPALLRKRDASLSKEQRQALGLHIAQRVWILPLSDGGGNGLGVFVLGERQGAPLKPESAQMDLITRIAGHAATAIQNSRRDTLQEDSFISLILALVEAIDNADHDSRHHGYSTANLAVAIGSYFSLSDEQLQDIRWAGLLHDIGKIEIPEEILCKPGPLTAGEWEIIRRHPVVGAEILLPVARLHTASEIIRAHHERYDGSGYPYGLIGEAIPFEARILTVADAYSVMIRGRVYRGAFTQAEAIAELDRCSGSDFDPQVVAALLHLVDQGTVF